MAVRTSTRGSHGGLGPQFYKALCTIQVAVAFMMCVYSLIYSDVFMLFLGIALALVATVAGAVSALNLQSFNIITGLVLLLLLTGHTGQVERQARVDCALAQLLMLDNKVRASVQDDDTSRQSIMSTIDMRLQALDSTLNTLESKADLVAPTRQIDRDIMERELQKEHQRQIWAAQESKLVASKLATVKKHAIQILQTLFEHSAAPDGKIRELEAAAAGAMNPSQVEELQRRLSSLFTNTERIVTKINKCEESGETLGADEYQQLLKGLESSMQSVLAFVRRVEDAVGGGHALYADVNSLLHGVDSAAGEAAPYGRPWQVFAEDAAQVADMLNRQSNPNAYQDIFSKGSVAPKLAKLTQRKLWEREILNRKEAVLEDTAKFCLKEGKGQKMLGFLSVLAMLLQIALVYCGICAVLPMSHSL